MDLVTEWALVLGSLFLAIAVSGSHIKALPITRAMVYLVGGLILGPLGLRLVVVEPLRDHWWIERIAQIAICIALFAAGLKLRAGIFDRLWLPAIRLATLSVAAAVLGVAAAGVLLLHLSWGVALILGAILSPTDPVLASDVEVERPSDDDPLRFTFTAEAALNDCTAAPFLALGLGVFSLEHGGVDFHWTHWVLVDLLWTTLGGLAVGAIVGALVGALVVYLRRQKMSAVGFDDFIVLGLIAFSFGCGTVLGVNGFLAVFASALALRQVELRSVELTDRDNGETPAWDEPEGLATHGVHAAAYLAHTSLQFSERLGHLGELVVVLIVGAMLTKDIFTLHAVLFTGAVLLVARPISVSLGLLGSALPGRERAYLSWFGIRGGASLYYLMVAARSVEGTFYPLLVQVTLLALGTSILVHGITVSPFMNRYLKSQGS